MLSSNFALGVNVQCRICHDKFQFDAGALNKLSVRKKDNLI